MLRRYNSKNLDTILLKTRRTTIGSGSNCDIQVKGKGIAQIHASIESNSSGYFLKEHSLSGITRVNEKPVFGQIEIHSGDLIQIGSSPPFVFDSEWLFGTRPNSAKITGKPENSSTVLPSIEVKKKLIGSRQSSASSTESQNRQFYSNSHPAVQNRSIGNNLLQRVVKLQAELIAKDEKIRQLTSSSASSSHSPSTVLYQALPPAPPTQNRHYSIVPRHSMKPILSDPKSFELFAYRAFIGAISSQLRQFNDRVLRNPQRDSADLFSAMCRAVDVPLSSRITEIEKYCEAVLIDNDFEDSEELMTRLETFIRESRREKILELTNELELIMPLIRDAALNAKENIKVCNVFTQWSRQFGDLLRKSSFSATVLFQAIEDLKTQFSEAHMSRHWLPPSITPILRLAALELEKRDGTLTPPTQTPPPSKIWDRRKSIDMTLDCCVSQVEAIVSEIEYHVLRLSNKAKDYSKFQPLDLDTVTRVTKIVDRLKSDALLLSEHAFKENRPNSVLFFEITNEDLKKSILKSDGTGSTSSLKSENSEISKKSINHKISKIQESFSENDEDRHEIEEKMKEIIRRMAGNLNFEESIGKEGLVTVDAALLKNLISESERLLNSYPDSEVRRKRSLPPIISVQEVVAKPGDSRTSEDVEFSGTSSGTIADSPEPTHDSPDENFEKLTSIEEEQSSGDKNSTMAISEASESSTIGSPEVLEYSDLGKPKIEDSESEESEISTPRNSPKVQEAPESEESKIPTSDISPEVKEYEDFGHPANLTSSESPEALEAPETSESNIPTSTASEDPSKTKILTSSTPEPSESKEPTSPTPEVSQLQNSESEKPSESSKSQKMRKSKSLTSSGPSEDVPICAKPFQPPSESEDVPEDVESDEKSTIRYVGVTPQNSIPENSEESDVIRNDDVRMTSHLRSHMNTANGKPMITYQYPIRQYFHSPPMKRRSKSEDQKIRETLSNRPPFVLY